MTGPTRTSPIGRRATRSASGFKIRETWKNNKYVDVFAKYEEPAMSAPRLACGSDDGKVRVFDAVSGGDTLLVIDAGDEVGALVVFD